MSLRDRLQVIVAWVVLVFSYILPIAFAIGVAFVVAWLTNGFVYNPDIAYKVIWPIFSLLFSAITLGYRLTH